MEILNQHLDVDHYETMKNRNHIIVCLYCFAVKSWTLYS